jgi:hypothetical protein
LIYVFSYTNNGALSGWFLTFDKVKKGPLTAGSVLPHLAFHQNNAPATAHKEARPQVQKKGFKSKV